MLWLKGWLETRFRLLFMLIFTAPLLFVMHSAGAHATASSVSGRVAGLVSHVIPFFIVFTCAFLAGAGIAIGLIAALTTTQLMTRFLYGVQPTDLTTLSAVSLLLLAVALLACYIPARKAMKVDPLIALRYE